MSHEIETMAFANALPWHGLGQNVDPSVSIEEMLKAAGLDWDVNLKPCYAWDEESGVAIPVSRQALVRSTDNKVLTVTGDNWNPLQNRDAMEFFREYTEAGGAKLETAGSLRGGKIVWALAALGDKFVLKGKDAVKGYLLLVSPHEVGASIKVFLTSVRVVCANTMQSANSRDGRAAHRQNHLKAFDAKRAKDAIGLMRIDFEVMHQQAKTLAKLEMTELETTRFLAQTFQTAPKEMGAFSNTASFVFDALRTPADKAKFSDHDALIEKLLREPAEQSRELAGVIDSLNNAPGAQPTNAWGVLNGVTHYFDHVAGRTADARLFQSWLGDRGRVKQEVNKRLLDFAA